jgi:energy-coupling factor transporter ATP-binding protein EcfA2
MEVTVTDGPGAGVGPLVEALDDLDVRLLDGDVEGERASLRSFVSGYLAARIEAAEGPLVVAVVGESGSGKSTLVNSLAGERVSPAGALRPTTRGAVIWTAEELPGTLDDVRRTAGDVVVGGTGPPEGLVVVDTPPPSVVGPDGRSIAASVVDRADVCWVVASGIRYADAAGWRLIDRAAARNLPIVVVLNRLPEDPDVQEVIGSDLRHRLAAAGGLPGGSPILTIAEGPIVESTAGLPPEWTSRLRKEFDALADPATRRLILRRNIAAGVRRVERGLRRLREAAVDAALVHGELLGPVEDAYSAEVERFAAALADGGMADLEAASPALPSDLAAMVARRCSRAARAAAGSWDRHPAGRHLLESDDGLWSHGPDVPVRARDRFEEWDRSLGALVLDTLGKRRMWRRRRDRYAALIRAAAVDPAFAPEPGRSARRWRRLGDAPEAARRWLAEVAGGLILADAGRFRAAIGTAPAGDALRRLRWPEGVPDG